MTPHDSTTADFEVRMRQIEDRHERHVAPEAYLVARLDGRAFHTLTKDLGVEKPFDAGFRDAMINAAKHVMQSGFNTAYAFVQSDEISVLFDALDATSAGATRNSSAFWPGRPAPRSRLDWVPPQPLTAGCWNLAIRKRSMSTSPGDSGMPSAIA